MGQTKEDTDKMQRITEYRDMCIGNVSFIKERIELQKKPGYDPIQPYTQATERQYYDLDLQEEIGKLNAANVWLNIHGTTSDGFEDYKY